MLPAEHHIFGLEHAWRIDGGQPVAISSDRGTRLLLGSRAGESRRATHVVKVLAESASERLQRYFARQAAIHLKMTANRSEPGAAIDACVGTEMRFGGVMELEDWCLDCATPLMVFPKLAAVTIDDWAAQQPEIVHQSTWLALGHQLLVTLKELHGLGYVHGNLRAEHVLIDVRERITLVGLGHCEMVGQPASGNGQAADSLADENREFEEAFGQDICAAADMIDLISGGRFGKTRLAASMRSDAPRHRPSANALVALFAAYRRRLGEWPTEFPPLESAA